MSTEQTEPTRPDQEWGAPPPPAAATKKRWTPKRVAVATAVAVGITAAGGAAIYAASGSVSNAQPGPGGGPVFSMSGGPGVMGFGPGDSQHGEFQNGEVTELTDDSITVQSDDGYTQKYTIDTDTHQSDDITQGDDVMVIATTEGDTPTATSVMEQGALPTPNDRRNGNDDGGPPNGGPQNGSGGN